MTVPDIFTLVQYEAKYFFECPYSAAIRLYIQVTSCESSALLCLVLDIVGIQGENDQKISNTKACLMRTRRIRYYYTIQLWQLSMNKNTEKDRAFTSVFVQRKYNYTSKHHNTYSFVHQAKAGVDYVATLQMIINNKSEGSQ